MCAALRGALLGSSLGLVVDGTRLLLLFGALMVVVGLLMLRPRGVGQGAEWPVDRRVCALTAAAALATGMASGFFGIGGGFLIVPALVFATGMPMINAVGTFGLAAGKATLNRIFAALILSVAAYVIFKSLPAVIGFG